MESETLGDIADAIRERNGLEETYRPGEMAEAIRALPRMSDLELRGLLLENGTLHITYRRSMESELGRVLQVYPVNPAGTSDYTGPWYYERGKIKKAVISPDVADAHVESIKGWFNYCIYMEEVQGFEALSGVKDVSAAFMDCRSLRSIFASEFDASGIEKSGGAFNGCYALVGGTGYCAAGADAAEALCFGEKGALTRPDQDARVWGLGRLYEDGYLEISIDASPRPDWGVLAEGLFCLNCRYDTRYGFPWSMLSYTDNEKVRRAIVFDEVANVPSTDMSYWFKSCPKLVGVEGLGHLRGLVGMAHAFEGCSSLPKVDLRGLDPSALEDVSNAFGECWELQTILVDAGWSLPASAVGERPFAGCKKLVGGAGTAWSSDAVGIERFKVDGEEPGYLTAQ